MTNSVPNWDNSLPSEVLRFPNKFLRSKVIADYIVKGGYKGTVIFSCGNAADALRRSLFHAARYGNTPEVVEVGPKGTLQPSKWFSPAEIHKTWPELFDATSGHLPITLMTKVAEEFALYLDGLHFDKAKQWYVPSGSGETILCLRLAYPTTPFCAVYDNSWAATTRDNDAPLNEVIDKLFPVEYWHGKLANQVS